MPDENLADILPIAKKIATAVGVPDYNVLQVGARLHAYSHSLSCPAFCDRTTGSWHTRLAGIPVVPMRHGNDVFDSQEVGHVHFHIIPKPEASDTQGLVIGWPQQKIEMDELKKYFEDLKEKLQ